jgi:hypothetical protein
MGCGASALTETQEEPERDVFDDLVESRRDACENEFMELTEDYAEHREAILADHDGKYPTEDEFQAWLNKKYGGCESLKLSNVMTVEQIRYWIDNAKQNKLFDGQLDALYRLLAARQETDTYEEVAKKIDVIFNRNHLQFWKDYAEQQEDSPSKDKILQRYNHVFHGCATVADAHSLRNTEHLEWWHSQYPDQGLDRRISLIKYGAEDEDDALEKLWTLWNSRLEHWYRVTNNPAFNDALMFRQYGAVTEEQALSASNMQEEHIEYWLQETGNPLFEDKLRLVRAPTCRLAELDRDELFDLFYIAQELGHSRGKEPIMFLDALCRKPAEADRQEELEEMMKCFDAEVLWKTALQSQYVDGLFKGENSATWEISQIKCLAQMHPVHQNDFWPIRHMLTDMSWEKQLETRKGQSQKRVFKLIVSLCKQNPRTAYNTQLAIKNGNFLVKCLNDWSEPSAYANKSLDTLVSKK